MSQNNNTSPSLLERVRIRDVLAWQRLVSLYHPLIRSWCLRGGASSTDADDIVQEVFLGIAGSIEQFQREREGGFRSWVRGITRHKLLDFQRRQGRHLDAATGGTDAYQILNNVPDPERDSTEDAAEAGDLYRRALDLIRNEFEERTWLAFWRAGVEGEDTAAVGAALSMTPVAVRIAKSRVLGRLREEVGELLG
jgi:RNA polymerase sigma-70 factor, ECF subfamily